jgi:hypothetical protein
MGLVAGAATPSAPFFPETRKGAMNVVVQCLADGCVDEFIGVDV